jgi:pimeloyl-ACP methyl ester carboxylesterase
LLHLRVSNTPDQPAIVFLHAIGTSASMWDEQLRELQDFSCLAPDLPGHGLSRSVPWRSLDHTADLIAEIIRRRTPGGRAHIVGLSLGSYVGLTLLSRHQDVVDRAVLSGINVLPLPHPLLMKILGYAMAPLLKTSLGARLNARALKIPEQHIENYRQSLQQLSLRSFIAANRDAGSFAMPENAANIETPTLLVAGEREHPLIHRSMAVLESVLPNSQRRLARGAGHGWSAELPGLFAETVRAWCRQDPLPGELLSPPFERSTAARSPES